MGNSKKNLQDSNQKTKEFLMSAFGVGKPDNRQSNIFGTPLDGQEGLAPN